MERLTDVEFFLLCALMLFYIFVFLTEFVADTTFHIFSTFQHTVLKAVHTQASYKSAALLFKPFTVSQLIFFPLLPNNFQTLRKLSCHVSRHF